MSNKVCVPHKADDLNLRVFSMITGINEWKTLTKHISWECKCKFDGTKCNSNQNWDNNKSRWKCKICLKICEKDYIWNPATCTCESGKCLPSIIDDSVIAWDEIIGAEKNSSYSKF